MHYRSIQRQLVVWRPYFDRDRHVIRTRTSTAGRNPIWHCVKKVHGGRLGNWAGRLVHWQSRSMAAHYRMNEGTCYQHRYLSRYARERYRIALIDVP